MKKNLKFPPKKLIFKPFWPKNVKHRLTYKFWFYQKYFRYSLVLQNFFLKHKKFYFFCYNLFRYTIYLNWTKFFSPKYYDIYLEDTRLHSLKYIPSLKKHFKHIGSLQKPFFLKKKIPPFAPIYPLSLKNLYRVDNFFLKLNYISNLKNFYKLIIYTTFLKILK